MIGLEGSLNSQEVGVVDGYDDTYICKFCILFGLYIDIFG